eukprot:g69811.t1
MSQRHTAVPPNNTAPAPDSSKHTVYMFGGLGAPSHSAEALTGEEWHAVPWSPPAASSGQLGLVLQGKLYAIGGRKSDDDYQLLRIVECYDPRLNRWEAKASLPVDYEYLTGAVLHDRLFVVLSDHDMHKSLLVYSPDANEWKTRCAPRTKRHEARLAALGDCLYLAGGHNNDYSLRKVEKYDPVHNEWLPAARLNLARHDFTVAVFRGRLYVIGGTNFDPDTELELGAVERYDPKARKWRFVGDLQTPRSGASAFVHNNGLHVAGGTTDFSATLLASVERFHEATAKWLESKPLAEPRLEACCAVLAVEPRPAKRQRLVDQ